MTTGSRISRLNLGETFASLKYPNYRLWFIGQLVSLVGTWTQSAAQGYLVYELTQSPEYLGYVSAAAGIPSWIFTLYAGAIADRIPRRTIILVCQVVMMLLALALAALAFTGLVQWWHVLILALLLGVANAFDAPARQSFILEMVDRESLTNAIALNSAMFTSAIVVGPAFGGLAYAWFGPGWCFVINAISFIAVIIALALMKLKPPDPTARKRSAGLDEIGEGLRYVWHEPTLRMLISNIGFTTIFGLGMVTLLPAWAVNILHGDSATNGFLLSARGVGSLLGALMIASLGRFNMRGKMWTLGSFGLPVFILIFSAIRWLPLSLLVMAGIGWSFIWLNNVTNALVQTHVPDHLRGRVMGIYTLVFFGSTPIGSLIAGNLAGWLGEPATLRINAAVLFVFAVLIYWLRPEMRALK